MMKWRSDNDDNDDDDNDDDNEDNNDDDNEDDNEDDNDDDNDDAYSLLTSSGSYSPLRQLQQLPIYCRSFRLPASNEHPCILSTSY